jgi:hypothetical protein
MGWVRPVVLRPTHFLFQFLLSWSSSASRPAHSIDGHQCLVSVLLVQMTSCDWRFEVPVDPNGQFCSTLHYHLVLTPRHATFVSFLSWTSSIPILTDFWANSCCKYLSNNVPLPVSCYGVAYLNTVPAKLQG